MNEQLSAFFGQQGLLVIVLAIVPTIIGGVNLIENHDEKRWPVITLAIGIILAVIAFILWSIAIYYNTIA